MKRIYFIVLILAGVTHAALAQTTRTGVLVIGAGNSAIGAAVQSAASGAKTVLLVPGQGFELSSAGKDQNSGLAAEFLTRVRKHKAVEDSLSQVVFDDPSAAPVLKTWMDSLKNLTLIRNAVWQKLKRSGSGWVTELNDGKTVKAEVLVNADQSGKVAAALQLPKTPALWQSFSYDQNIYRTSISSGYFTGNSSANIISLYRLLNPSQENLISLDDGTQSFAAGQAGGATAAYAAFYKVKTSEANLKTIQAELINYKLSLVPFDDIKPTDSNWKAMQFIGLTGLLKAAFRDGKASFEPEKLVSTAEIDPVIREYYYKAQLWFDDYKAPQMTIGSTLSLVCTVGHKAINNTEEEIKKRWNTTYHFKTAYDPDRQISRREFAVLANDYLAPFYVNIDQNGRVQK